MMNQHNWIGRPDSSNRSAAHVMPSVILAQIEVERTFE